MKLMKLCVGLLFLAVAALPACRGDNNTMDAAEVGPTTPTPAPLTADAPLNTTATAVNATEPAPTPRMSWESMENVTVAETTEGAELNTTSHATSSADAKSGGGEPGVTTTTVSSSTTAAFLDAPGQHTTDDSEADGSPSWGYVLLVLIILAIIILLVVLYLLRRSSKSYSFDLHRAGPSADLGEPIGTFEPVYLDDLDRPAPTDQDGDDELSIPPEVDHTVLPLENGASEDPQEQLEPNGLSNVGDAEQTPDPETPGDQQSGADLLGDEPTNENNNNPSQSFVEINLDEPAWCDQLLASPDAAASSSVLPFSFPLTTSSSSPPSS